LSSVVELGFKKEALKTLNYYYVRDQNRPHCFKS
jgi:hypothetical protein